MINTKKVLPVAILIICLSITFIIASILISPASFTVNEDVSYRYNITINNTGVGQNSNITVVNITLPSGFVFSTDSNRSTVKSTFSNISNVLTWTNYSVGLINGTYNETFTFNATMATAGAWHNITITTVNSTGSFWQNISVYVNDTTFPLVSFVTPVAGENYSDSFIINVSITDDTPSKVYFNITNATGVQNTSSLVASRIGTSTYWNATINTSLYADGIYNVTVYVNDSNNQLNSTIYKVIRIDNTAPVITYFYCTPASVYLSATTTCTCTTLADAGSGISSTTFTESPSTSTLGTSTQTCTLTDRAGNSVSATTTFEVVSRPSGDASSSGSSTTQTWSNTYTATETQFQTGYAKTLGAKERVKVRVVNADHYIGVKSITSTSATIEIASDPVEVTLDIGEDAKIDVNEDGTYDIYVILNNIVDGKAEITIMKISEEIAQGEEAVTTTGEITTPKEETPSETMKSKTWIIVIVIILVLIIIGAGYKIKKK